MLLASFCFVPAIPDAEERPASSFENVIAAATYYSGDILGAIDLLQKAAAEAGAPSERVRAHLDLLYVCSSVDDYKCFADSLAAAFDELGKIDGKSDEGQLFIKKYLGKQLTPWLLYHWWWRGEYQMILESPLVEGMNQIPVYEIEPINYLILQETLTLTYYIDYDTFNSRKSITRMINYLMLANNTNRIKSKYIIARYLSEIIQSFYIIKDSFNSFKYVIYFDQFILDNLPAQSIEIINYLALSAEVKASERNPTAGRLAIERLGRAHDLLEGAKIDGAFKRNRLSYFPTLQAAIALGIGQIDDAYRYHLQNPLMPSRDDIIQQGSFASNDEFNFAIADLYIAHHTKHPVEARWKSLIEKPLRWEAQGRDENEFRSLRLFGLGLIGAAEGSDSWRDDLSTAAELRIDDIEQQLAGISGVFPLPSFVDRIILNEILSVYSASDQPLSEREKNIALRSAEVIERGPRHASGDYLHFASNLTSETSRRLAQSWLQLSRRLSEIEYEALQQLTAQYAGAEIDPETTRQTYSDYSRSLIELSRQRETIRDVFFEGEIKEHLILGLPNIQEIQSALEDKEALVFHALGVGSIYNICVRHDRFFLNSRPIPQSIELDLKLLRGALTATHPISDVLDARYPVKAALRVNELLLGGFEECFAAASKLSYIPLGEIADIPIETLLESLPPETRHGFDLSKASWLLKRFAISQTGSIQEFLASRKLEAFAGGSLPFLGVGDPTLAEPTDQGISGGELIALRGAPTSTGALAQLSELPETGEELRAIASKIDGSIIRTRLEATEALVRAEPLGHYNLISFATHGLIQGDYDGISEPGLVLTPPFRSEGNAQNDGLLTASEIASIKLNARIVVLSACNTANFDTTVFAQGLRSLSSAFSVSGVPTIVASLWPVETHASKAIMTEFFAELTDSRGKDAATALAEAKRQFIEDSDPPFAHPRFWAPFIVVGNGSTTAQQSASDEAIILTSFNRIDDPGGEIFSSDASRSGEIYLTRMGDWNGERMASFVEKRGMSGEVIWQHKSREIGAGMMVSAGERIYVSGYFSENDGQVTVPVVRAFDKDGREVWTWMATIGRGVTAHLLDMKSSDDGKLILLEQRIVTRNNSSSSAFIIYRLDQNGSILDMRPLASLDWIHSFTTGQISERDNDTLAFINNPIDFGDFPKVRGDFGDFRACPSRGITVLLIPDVEELGVNLVSNPEIHIRKVVHRDGETLVIGTRLLPCQMDGHAFFGKVSEDGKIEPIYVESALYPSEFTDLVADGRRILLSGTWSRRFSEHPSGKRLEDIKATPMHLLSLDDYEIREGVFVLLSEDQFVRRDFVGAGTSTIVRSLSAHDDVVSFTGLVGLYPLMGSFKYPDSSGVSAFETDRRH